MSHNVNHLYLQPHDAVHVAKVDFEPWVKVAGEAGGSGVGGRRGVGVPAGGQLVIKH